MLSLVTGATVGVSKRVAPIVVRVPRRNAAGGGSKPEDWLKAMGKVVDAFTDESPNQARAVLLMAFYWPREYFMIGDTDYSHGFRKRLNDYLQELARKGVVLVTGSGNDGKAST